MFQCNSQEQTIYRSLAARIQLGFYDGNSPFPTAQEIAAGYEVSFCPAQRALKALENDGLIKLCRGRRTIVLRKPYENFLKSDVFQSRVAALIDLIRALRLFSSDVCFQGLCRAENGRFPQLDAAHPGKRLYQLFDHSIRALGSRTIRSLYSDIGAFAQSAFQDILYEIAGVDGANRYLTQLTQALYRSLQDCRSHRYDTALKGLRDMESKFFDKQVQYLNHLSFVNGAVEAECFLWEPRKGRTRYCDIIAIDLLRKINQGVCPVGTLLPNGAQLSDTYHVSEITIRRTIALLNQLGVTKTKNGVGTYVVSLGNASVAHKIKDIMNDDNYIAFLEALQFLAITGKTVIPITFAHCPENALYAIARAADIRQPHKAMVATIGACLQAIVHHCPFAAVREIYAKLTLSLLGGSVLQFDESGRRPAPDWAEISTALGVSLKAKNGERFAKAFCALAESCFFTMKRKLMEIGVEGAERVADPVCHFHE